MNVYGAVQRRSMKHWGNSCVSGSATLVPLHRNTRHGPLQSHTGTVTTSEWVASLHNTQVFHAVHGRVCQYGLSTVPECIQPFHEKTFQPSDFTQGFEKRDDNRNEVRDGWDSVLSVLLQEKPHFPTDTNELKMNVQKPKNKLEIELLIHNMMHAELSGAETEMDRLGEKEALLVSTIDQLAQHMAGSGSRGGKWSEKLMQSLQREHVWIALNVQIGSFQWCLCEVAELQPHVSHWA